MNTIINIQESFDNVNKKLTDVGYKVKTAESESTYLISSENIDDTYTGCILEKDTNQLVCQGQRKIIDVSREKLIDMFKQRGVIGDFVKNTNEIRVEYCEDGTLMRLYYYNGNWMTATTNCTDARKSFWSCSRSFDSMFWEVFNSVSHIDTLDKCYTYYFVLMHNENRLVVNHRTSHLVYLHRNNGNMDDYTEVFNKIFWRPFKVKPFNIDTLGMTFWNKKRGILVKFNGDECIYKMDFDEYKAIKDIRGNNPNIEMRYIELLNDEAKQRLLLYYYNENANLFTKIAKLFSGFVYHIHQLYLESHVKHTKIIDKSHTYFPLVKSLHAQYKRTHNRITYNDVKQKISNMHVNIINDLFKKLELPN